MMPDSKNEDSVYIALLPISKECVLPEKLMPPYSGWRLRASKKTVILPEDLSIIPTGFKLAANKPCLLHITLDYWLIKLGVVLVVNTIPLHKNADESAPLEITVANVLGDYIAIKEGHPVASFFVTEITESATIINVKNNAH